MLIPHYINQIERILDSDFNSNTSQEKSKQENLNIILKILDKQDTAPNIQTVVHNACIQILKSVKKKIYSEI